MNENLDTTAKQIGGSLIELSDVMSAKMEKWSEVSRRPNSLSDTECVGFINKESATDGLSLVVDIQAAANANDATLRLWAIGSEFDSDDSERFNNIQLDFDMDYAVAREFAQKGAAITRDDIRAALNEPSTQLSNVVVSNRSGFDKAAQAPLGERYELDLASADQPADLVEKISSALPAVLATLKNSIA